MNRRRTNPRHGFVPPQTGFTPHRAGFTLIELLVVISIIAVLFAVAMPIFENVGRKDTDRAAFNLMTTLRLARQHAISKRQWTLVIFPNEDGGPYSDKDIGKCLRGYAVLAVTGVKNFPGIVSMDGLARENQIPDNMVFTFVSDWKTMPDGIFFDDNKELSGNYLFATRTDKFKYPMDPSKPDVTKDPTARPMGVLLFRPNGRAYKMAGDTTSGKWWQDTDYSKIYMTSAKYYEQAGGLLSSAQTIPGTNSIVQIRNKTGQVHIWTP